MNFLKPSVTIQNVMENFSEKIINLISEGVIIIENFKVLSANRAAQKITGFSIEQMKDKFCFEILRCELCQKKCPLKSRRKFPIEIPCVSAVDKFNEEKFLRVRLESLEKKWVIIVEDRTREVRLSKESFGKYGFSDIITASPKVLEIIHMLPKLAVSDSPVLIEGKSGTGKELFASAIKNLSKRKNKAFVKINCAAIPEGLIESELFGYKKGAFTDARIDKKGLFSVASGGTIFLDEVAELPQQTQAKLLRVLEQGEIIPLGATSPEKVDARIISSTNKNLRELVREGKFREDLFYRINVVYIYLPPLKERKEDIPLLVEHFIEFFDSIKGKNIKEIKDGALKILINYDYPGNVRELKNIIESAFVLADGEYIDVQHLPLYLREEKAEKRRVEEALIQAKWVKSEAAKILGVSRATLWRKMKKYRIS